MNSYLLTADEGAHEQFFDVPSGLGLIDPDQVVAGLAIAHMRDKGIKIAHLFRANEDRWMVRLELP